MARIRTTHTQEHTVIIVDGRLAAGDMGRLEHACSPELVSRTPRLKINLRRVTAIDQTALAVLGRMAARGAVLITKRATGDSVVSVLHQLGNRGGSAP